MSPKSFCSHNNANLEGMSHLKKRKKEKKARCESGTQKCLTSPGPQEEEKGLRGLPGYSHLAERRILVWDIIKFLISFQYMLMLF